MSGNWIFLHCSWNALFPGPLRPFECSMPTLMLCRDCQTCPCRWVVFQSNSNECRFICISSFRMLLVLKYHFQDSPPGQSIIFRFGLRDRISPLYNQLDHKKLMPNFSNKIRKKKLCRLIHAQPLLKWCIVMLFGKYTVKAISSPPVGLFNFAPSRGWAY